MSNPNSVLEVTQTLGDTLVATHHISPPQPPGRISRKLLAAIGAACLLASLFAFGKGVSVAAANDAALHQWVEVSRQPIGEFRPVRLSLAYDALAFGGLFAAIFCFAGALGMRRRLAESLRAGDSDDAEVSFPGQPAFELVRSNGLGLVIALPHGHEGIVRSAESEPRQVNGVVALAAGERLALDTGLCALRFSWVTRPRRADLATAIGLESRTAKFIAASALAHGLALALLLSIPPDAKAMSHDNADDTLRLAGIRVDANENKPIEKQPTDDKEPGAEGAALMTAASTKGDKGDPTAPARLTKAAIKRRTDGDPTLAKKQWTAKEMVDVGIVGALRDQTFVNQASLADFANGLSDDDIYGNSFHANDLGPGGGPGGGWGDADGTGVSPYPGGTGTIAAPGYKIGDPNGSEYGSKYAGAGDGLGNRETKSPKVIIKHATPNCGVAGCDKEIIGRHIRRQKRRIRNCYERGLLTHPELAGTVMSRFIITADGRVQSSKASGIGHKGVEACIAGVVASIKFPVVTGGSMASVRYPFNLSQAGRSN